MDGSYCLVGGVWTNFKQNVGCFLVLIPCFCVCFFPDFLEKAWRAVSMFGVQTGS